MKLPLSVLSGSRKNSTRSTSSQATRAVICWMPPSRPGEVAMDWQAGGLVQHTTGGAGGDDRVAGKNAAVRGAELKREFFAGIMRKDCDGSESTLLPLSQCLVADEHLLGLDSLKRTISNLKHSTHNISHFQTFHESSYRAKMGLVKRKIVFFYDFLPGSTTFVLWRTAKTWMQPSTKTRVHIRTIERNCFRRKSSPWEKTNVQMGVQSA